MLLSSDNHWKIFSDNAIAYRVINIIINIFVSIDTGICADSTRRFNKEASALENTVVVCISRDLPFALGRICDAESLNDVIPVSAFNSSFGTDYGVTILDGPMQGLLSRSVVVINTQGEVIYTEQVPEIAQEPDYDSAIAVLASWYVVRIAIRK